MAAASMSHVTDMAPPGSGNPSQWALEHGHPEIAKWAADNGCPETLAPYLLESSEEEDEDEEDKEDHAAAEEEEEEDEG
jgi:hypothetical protein